MKICFYGVGGVGGYFGALLARKYQHEHESILLHGASIRKPFVQMG